MLIDSGPLLSLCDYRQPTHSICQSILRSARLPFLTTWACWTEAMYLVGRLGGFHYQQYLWRLMRDENVVLHRHDDDEITRISALMESYQNVPMDLADASLITCAETREERTIFTLDSHFRIYRFSNGQSVTIAPE